MSDRAGLVLTRFEPLLAFDDLQHVEPSAVALLAARNALLMAAAWVLWPAATRARPIVAQQEIAGAWRGAWTAARSRDR